MHYLFKVKLAQQGSDLDFGDKSHCWGHLASYNQLVVNIREDQSDQETPLPSLLAPHTMYYHTTVGNSVWRMMATLFCHLDRSLCLGAKHYIIHTVCFCIIWRKLISFTHNVTSCYVPICDRPDLWSRVALWPKNVLIYDHSGPICDSLKNSFKYKSCMKNFAQCDNYALITFCHFCLTP